MTCIRENCLFSCFLLEKRTTPNVHLIAIITYVIIGILITFVGVLLFTIGGSTLVGLSIGFFGFIVFGIGLGLFLARTYMLRSKPSLSPQVLEVVDYPIFEEEILILQQIKETILDFCLQYRLDESLFNSFFITIESLAVEFKSLWDELEEGNALSMSIRSSDILSLTNIRNKIAELNIGVKKKLCFLESVMSEFGDFQNVIPCFKNLTGRLLESFNVIILSVFHENFYREVSTKRRNLEERLQVIRNSRTDLEAVLFEDSDFFNLPEIENIRASYCKLVNFQTEEKLKEISGDIKSIEAKIRQFDRKLKFLNTFFDYNSPQKWIEKEVSPTLIRLKNLNEVSDKEKSYQSLKDEFSNLKAELESCSIMMEASSENVHFLTFMERYLDNCMRRLAYDIQVQLNEFFSGDNTLLESKLEDKAVDERLEVVFLEKQIEFLDFLLLEQDQNLIDASVRGVITELINGKKLLENELSELRQSHQTLLMEEEEQKTLKSFLKLNIGAFISIFLFLKEKVLSDENRDANSVEENWLSIRKEDSQIFDMIEFFEGTGVSCKYILNLDWKFLVRYESFFQQMIDVISCFSEETFVKERLAKIYVGNRDILKQLQEDYVEFCLLVPKWKSLYFNIHSMREIIQEFGGESRALERFLTNCNEEFSRLIQHIDIVKHELFLLCSGSPNFSFNNLFGLACSFCDLPSKN